MIAAAFASSLASVTQQITPDPPDLTQIVDECGVSMDYEGDAVAELIVNEGAAAMFNQVSFEEGSRRCRLLPPGLVGTDVADSTAAPVRTMFDQQSSLPGNCGEESEDEGPPETVVQQQRHLRDHGIRLRRERAVRTSHVDQNEDLTFDVTMYDVNANGVFDHLETPSETYRGGLLTGTIGPVTNPDWFYTLMVTMPRLVSRRPVAALSHGFDVPWTCDPCVTSGTRGEVRW